MGTGLNAYTKGPVCVIHHLLVLVVLLVRTPLLAVRQASVAHQEAARPVRVAAKGLLQ